MRRQSPGFLGSTGKVILGTPIFQFFCEAFLGIQNIVSSTFELYIGILKY